MDEYGPYDPRLFRAFNVISSTLIWARKQTRYFQPDQWSLPSTLYLCFSEISLFACLPSSTPKLLPNTSSEFSELPYNDEKNMLVTIQTNLWVTFAKISCRCESVWGTRQRQPQKRTIVSQHNLLETSFHKWVTNRLGPMSTFANQRNCCRHHTHMHRNMTTIAYTHSFFLLPPGIRLDKMFFQAQFQWREVCPVCAMCTENNIKQFPPWQGDLERYCGW